MKISVIVPVYNGRNYLPECLDSIGNQILQPEEVIVIDDVSAEPVDDIVDIYAARQGYPQIHLLRLDINQGQAAARNMGILQSRGDWLAFLDHDDIWDPDHLAEQKKTAMSSGADLVFCQAKLFRGHLSSGFICHAIPKTYKGEALEPLDLMKDNFIIMSSCLIRKDALTEVGLFDVSPALRSVEDLDLFLKLMQKNMKFAMSEQASLNYRKHDESATGRLGHMVRQIVNVTEKHIHSVSGSSAVKNHLRCDVSWRAANETFCTKASDRWFWLARSVYLTVIKLKRLDLYFYRFVRFQLKHFLI